MLSNVDPDKCLFNSILATFCVGHSCCGTVPCIIGCLVASLASPLGASSTLFPFKLWQLKVSSGVWVTLGQTQQSCMSSSWRQVTSNKTPNLPPKKKKKPILYYIFESSKIMDFTYSHYTHPHTYKWKLYQVTDVLTSLIGIIISQCIMCIKSLHGTP